MVLFSSIGLVFDDIFRYSLDTVVLETGVFVELDDEFTEEPEKVYLRRYILLDYNTSDFTSNDNI